MPDASRRHHEGVCRYSINTQKKHVKKQDNSEIEVRYGVVSVVPSVATGNGRLYRSCDHSAIITFTQKRNTSKFMGGVRRWPEHSPYYTAVHLGQLCTF